MLERFDIFSQEFSQTGWQQRVVEEPLFPLHEHHLINNLTHSEEQILKIPLDDFLEQKT